jgi:hypothetical protein
MGRVRGDMLPTHHQEREVEMTVRDREGNMEWEEVL